MFVLTTESQKFGADAVLLADFAAPKGENRICDLCSGCGIVSLLWSRDGNYNIDAVEIQHEAALLAKRSVMHNKLANINVIENDLRQLDDSYNGIYGLVACNPPYKKAGTGKVSIKDADAAARHETLCTLEDVVKTASRILKGGGRFCVCHRPERLADLITLMRLNKLEPKRLRFVQQRSSSRPWLVLAEGKKSAKPGLMAEPALIIEDSNGNYTDEIKKIYRYFNH